MEILSYNPQGKLIKIVNFDFCVPEYIKSYDKNHSVLLLYKSLVDNTRKSNIFTNYLKTITAETLFNIDYGNFLKSSFSLLKIVEKQSEGSFVGIPRFAEREFEFNKLTGIIKYYGHKSRRQIENDHLNGKYLKIDCLSNSSWILSLADYANRKTSDCEGDERSLMFIIAFQSVINRYYIALRNMSYFKDANSSELDEQIQILKPFISKNLFRVNDYDIWEYNDNKFLIKLVNHLSNYCIGRRHDSYCILQLLRGDYQLVNNANNSHHLRNFEISNKIISDFPICYNLGECDGSHREIKISDKELASLIDSDWCVEGIDCLFQTINEIKDGYERIFGSTWDSDIARRRLHSDCYRPEKIQSWSYLFYDEILSIRQFSKEELVKEQACFYKLIYDTLVYDSPQIVKINGVLLYKFFCLIKLNKCSDQHGFYEKIYTIDKIINNADIDDIKLMNKETTWDQIKLYKNRIEAVDYLLNFLEPILNGNYVNEDVISTDNLKRMIKNLLKMETFFKMTAERHPDKLLKKIEGENKKGLYKYNLALLFNILGALYGHVIRDSKGPHYLLKQNATKAFNELVSPYGIKNDKNYAKFITQYNCHNSFSLINTFQENIIVSEMKMDEYYK